MTMLSAGRTRVSPSSDEPSGKGITAGTRAGVPVTVGSIVAVSVDMGALVWEGVSVSVAALGEVGSAVCAGAEGEVLGGRDSTVAVTAWATSVTRGSGTSFSFGPELHPSRKATAARKGINNACATLIIPPIAP